MKTRTALQEHPSKHNAMQRAGTTLFSLLVWRLRAYTALASIVLAVYLAMEASTAVGAVPVSAIFYSDYGTQTIRRVNPNGTGATTVLTGLSNVRSLAVDLGAGKLYFVEQVPNRIRRSNLDGSAAETVVTAGGYPYGMAIDLARGKLYWTEYSIGIRRANFDGSGTETVPLAGLDNPVGLALDVEAGKVYWSDAFAGTISRASLDGTGQETLATGIPGPVGPNQLALDVANGHLYWAESSTSRVMRSNLDGSGATTFVSGPAVQVPSGLAVDAAAGKVYWANEPTGTIGRANLDGGGIETFQGGLANPVSLALLVESPPPAVFFSDYGTQTIWRVNPDGMGATSILSGLSNVRGLAVDSGAEKLYFIEQTPHRIRRSNLDGTAAETVVIPSSFPYDVELDLVRGKLYWTEYPSDVRRANLDGSGIETLPLSPSGVPNVVGLALDVEAGKVYWTDYFAGTISRADLDGSAQETLVSGIPVPHGPNQVALDVANGQMYWTETSTNRVMRSNLDGSGAIALVSGPAVVVPAGLALDAVAGKIYWANEPVGTIGRANLDGTNVEVFQSGLVNPVMFALLPTASSIPPPPPWVGPTPVGSDVQVVLLVTMPDGLPPAAVAVVFDNVLSEGLTSVTASMAGFPPPTGFKVGDPTVYYDVSTTATFLGNAELCFNWIEGQFSNEEAIRLWHFEFGMWNDVTTSVDTVNNVACGTVTSLSPFALFEVAYRFAGFFQPVDNPPTLNTLKAGQAVPVKFSLGGYRGLNIFDPGYPASKAVSCSGFTSSDAIEETVTAGASGLQYSATTDQYTYVWKTNSTWANTCRLLILDFKDGSQHVADFQFRK